MQYRINPETTLAITEDDLTNALFYNTPLNVSFTGSKADARDIARAMLGAVEVAEMLATDRSYDDTLLGDDEPTRDVLAGDLIRRAFDRD